MTTADDEVLARWWAAFVDGGLPDELEHVQGRLIRAVHRGRLPSGPVHVKTMSFPRAKDRLRYALRPLPGVHEAAMLAAVAAAGIPCPEVVAVRSLRRAGLPHRSMLVLRSLPVAPEPADAEPRLRDEVAVAAALLAAGVLHRDLHGENFVRLDDGRLAVLDLQSASRSSAAAAGRRGPRLAVAARLLRERQGDRRRVVLAALREHGVLRDEVEAAAATARADAERARYGRSRLRRCLTTSTEFVRRVRWDGIECRRRDAPADGRWWAGPTRRLRRAWLGQRARELAGESGAPPTFCAFFRKWWWLGGGAALYVPSTCSDERIEAEVRTASAAIDGQVSERAARSMPLTDWEDR